jgi:hypothetical protein
LQRISLTLGQFTTLPQYSPPVPSCWQSAQDPVGDKRIIMLFWSTIDSAP